MLNLDQRTKNKAAFIAAAFAPLIAVQAVRYLVLGDAAPASAGAAVHAGMLPPPAMPDGPKSLTPAQVKAAQWLTSRPVALNLRSPMDKPDPVAAAPEPITATTPSITTPEPQPVADDTPRHLVLTGILGGGGESSRSLVSISHRIYRVGEEVVPGWRIGSIDGKKRTVTLTQSDGRTFELTPPSP